MRLVIQRVLQAEVQVNENTVGKINKGLLVFVGAGHEDSREVADKYLKKLLGLRIFEDENGKTNLSLKDVNGIFGADMKVSLINDGPFTIILDEKIL